MHLALLALVACAPAAPTAPASPPPAADPYADLAAMDTRAALPLTPRMANHQRENMRGHLEAVQTIVVGLGAEDWAAVERGGAAIGTSPQMKMMCEHMGAGAPGFTERGLAFHATADRIGEAARQKDRAAAFAALSDTLAACTACHAAYRQDVLSEADYAAATGAPPPTHSEAGP